MALIRRSSVPTPRPLLEDLPDRIRQMFEGTLQFEPFAEPLGWLPAMEIIEKDNALIVTAELPGVNMGDVNITLEDGVLTVTGEKKEEKEEKDEGKENFRYHMWERQYGSFKRAFTLPKEIDAEKIAATFDNGILTVTLPKTDKAKVQGKKITISGRK